MILIRAQAEAIYSAMVALNNVSGIIHVRLPISKGRHVIVQEDVMTDDIFVAIHNKGGGRESLERYANQADFAEAYDVE